MLPAISTAAYGYPLGQVARIAVHEAKIFLERGDGLERLFFAALGAEARNTFVAVIDGAFSG